jgi:predicted flap endonuclease-1-like 5' DNA nuclease
MNTISTMNGSISQFKLQTSRMVVDALVNQNLDDLEIVYGKEKMHDAIEKNFDEVMDIFQHLKTLGLENNERLILSRSKLACYLLSKALTDKGFDIKNVGSIAHYMARHVNDLIYGVEKDGKLEVGEKTLAYYCIDTVLEKKNLRIEINKDGNKLKLIDETLRLLYNKKHDFTGSETENRILECYHSVVKQGFLPQYVDEYLNSINATPEQSTPEIRQAMIRYLMESGLKSDQYAVGKDPWTEEIDNFDKKNTDKFNKYDNEINNFKNDIGGFDGKVSTAISTLETKIPAKVEENTQNLKADLENAKGDIQKLTSSIGDLDKEIKILQSKEIDDLTIIEGIGNATKVVLYEKGVKSFRKLAKISTPELTDILSTNNLKQLIASSQSWQQQAQLALEGKWEDLKILKDKLTGGVPPKS